MKQPRIALVVSHPIQHFCPMYASLAQRNDIEIKVFFASQLGLKKYHDRSFGKELQWDSSILQLDRFPHTFLQENEQPITTRLDAEGLGEALAHFNPDVVVVYGYSQRLQQRAFLWALMNRKKIFHIADSEVHRKSSVWKDLLKTFPLRFYYQYIDAFLTVGNANENYYYRYGVPTWKMFRSFFPIHVDSFESIYQEKEKHRLSLRQELQIGEDELVFSVVGKLVPWKSQISLIQAIQYLEQQNITGVVGWLIGSGQDMDALKSVAQQLKKNRVQITGFIPPQELPRYYLATDVYTHTSFHEPHSLAISEALYMGKPLILSDTCGSYGSTDDLQVGKNGFVYPVAHPKALAERMKRFVSNRQLLTDFGQFSRVLGVMHQRSAHGEGMLAALRANGLL